MSYDRALKHGKEASAYRLEVRKARTLAMRLANKMLQDALDKGSEVTPELMKAMSEAIRAGEELFGRDAKKGLKNKPGLRVDSAEVEKALKDLEGGE